jgi:putative ATPase
MEPKIYFVLYSVYTDYMQPLAEQQRPATLADYVGQLHLVGDGKIIPSLITQSKKTGFFPSLIFWGPPGVGKTTLARIIAKELDRPFFEFSAVSTSAKEIAAALTTESELSPIVFIDEIHRFNKAQQDKLLPLVEKGAMILIGATTENPSFEVIRPLLSRSRVLVLKELGQEDLEQVLSRALTNTKKKLSADAREFLIRSSNGDARILLNVLEIALSISQKGTISVAELEQAMQRKSIGFDREGEEHYNTISAFIKSMRASQPDAALYYLARMIEAGQDPLYIARRMVVFASEDIGMAAPTALVVANEVFRSCEIIGYPECSINLAHGVVYLATAKKDRRSYDAFQKARADVTNFGNLPIPMHVRNAPTSLMKELGYGKGYQMYDDKSYLPDKLSTKTYFEK